MMGSRVWPGPGLPWLRWFPVAGCTRGFTALGTWGPDRTFMLHARKLFSAVAAHDTLISCRFYSFAVYLRHSFFLWFPVVFC